MTTDPDEQTRMMLEKLQYLERQGTIRRDPTCRRWVWSDSGRTVLTDLDLARGYFNLGVR
jgi:hypothetical protein